MCVVQDELLQVYYILEPEPHIFEFHTVEPDLDIWMFHSEEQVLFYWTGCANWSYHVELVVLHNSWADQFFLSSTAGNSQRKLNLKIKAHIVWIRSKLITDLPVTLHHTTVAFIIANIRLNRQQKELNALIFHELEYVWMSSTDTWAAF